MAISISEAFVWINSRLARSRRRRVYTCCLTDTWTLILVLVPLLLPTTNALGINPVHFGVLITINIMIGLITPPFGMLLFTLAKLGDVPIGEIVADLLPFLLALILALAIVTFVPQTVLWLPALFGF